MRGQEMLDHILSLWERKAVAGDPVLRLHTIITQEIRSLSFPLALSGGSTFSLTVGFQVMKLELNPN